VFATAHQRKLPLLFGLIFLGKLGTADEVVRKLRFAGSEIRASDYLCRSALNSL